MNYFILFVSIPNIEALCVQTRKQIPSPDIEAAGKWREVPITRSTIIAINLSFDQVTQNIDTCEPLVHLQV